MSDAPLPLTLETARRLAVTKQGLSGKQPSRPSAAAICSIVREIAYVQWDPVPIVAPSHILSLWARLGDFRVSDLERLLWKERKLLLHWTPMASIVLAEDYPLYSSLMTRYPESLTSSWGNHRIRARQFLAEHADLRRTVRRELRNGPLTTGQFKEHAKTKRNDVEWAFSSDLSQMLFHLLMSGEVMVVGHEGNQNLWGLTEQFLPSEVETEPLSKEAFERESAQRAIRALGTATAREITYYFPRGRYERLQAALDGLEEASAIRRVAVDGVADRKVRYVHTQDLPLLATVDSSGWEPRVSLLPPFDNLIGSSARTKSLFGFDYVREQFLPPEKRRYGTYVLPILWGERLIGRIDPRMDRDRGVLMVNSVHAEPDAPRDRELAARIGETIDRLAAFLGAGRVAYSRKVPAAWRSSLR